jgi:hypothetical protein
MKTVRLDTIFSLCSRVGDEWFATITAKYNSGEPVIAIVGPFADREEASAYNGMCLEFLNRRGELRLADTASVPAEARQSITDDILRGWRDGQFERLRSRQGDDDFDNVVINLEPKN